MMTTSSKILSVPGQPEPCYAPKYWGNFALLSPFGRNVLPRGKKARAIILYVIAHAPLSVRRERLATLLWGDRGEEQARASLRQSLYELRHLRVGPMPMICISREEVHINPERIKSFDKQLSELIAAPDLVDLAAALSDCNGAFFQNMNEISADFDNWLAAERARYQAELIQQVVAILQSYLPLMDSSTARKIVNILETIDPLDESITRIAMRIDAQTNDIVTFEKRFQHHTALLASELGVGPSAETQKLHRQLLFRLQAGKPKARTRIMFTNNRAAQTIHEK
jgi:DNA-binding SARP family transcriptional activator